METVVALVFELLRVSPCRSSAIAEAAEAHHQVVQSTAPSSFDAGRARAGFLSQSSGGARLPRGPGRHHHSCTFIAR